MAQQQVNIKRENTATVQVASGIIITLQYKI